MFRVLESLTIHSSMLVFLNVLTPDVVIKVINIDDDREVVDLDPWTQKFFSMSNVRG